MEKAEKLTESRKPKSGNPRSHMIAIVLLNSIIPPSLAQHGTLGLRHLHRHRCLRAHVLSGDELRCIQRKSLHPFSNELVGRRDYG